MSATGDPEFHPYDQAFAADPYPVYARLREHSPVFRDRESGLTYFTRYGDIARLLQDARLGRTMDHLLPRGQVEQQRASAEWHRLPNYSRYVRVNLLETEGEDHTRLRRLLTAFIKPRRIRALRSRIQDLVEELLTAQEPRGQMDFLADVAEPLPVHVISELLGWPAGERHRLRPWSAAIVRLYEANHTAEDEARAEAAASEFAAMLHRLADRRRSDPRDDLISALVAVENQPGTLTRDELIANCMLVLNAGHEATVNAAGNGLLALLRHPDQLARLQDEPALLKSAVEEMLRYDSPLHLFQRYVLEDMHHGETELRQGEQVGFLYASANRDPDAFERCDDFDIGRRPNRHLAFGGGKHFCIGAPLARLELEILFATLLDRFPRIRLEDAQPAYRTGLVFRGLKRLPVRW